MLRKKKLLAELSLLKDNTTSGTHFLPLKEISDRNIFELYQINLIKILALEISGFETPGTKLGINDAEITLHKSNQLIQLVGSRLSKDTLLWNHFKQQQLSAENFLKHSSKEIRDFDHLTFVKDHLLPLYQYCVTLHERSGVEFSEEVNLLPQSINWHSPSPFHASFLNPSYFSRIETHDQRKIELGRLLFYDPILSKNNERACASCHAPAKAFTDGQKTSLAFDFKGRIERNAPTLTNAVYSSAFFYDLRAEMIGQQVEHVVHSPKEFATNFIEIEAKLKDSKTYEELFKSAFPEAEGSISKANLVTALGAFVQAQRAWNSEFDQFINGEKNSLPKEAQAGFNLFMGKAQCATCHFLPNFSGLAAPWYEESESENLGIIEKWDTVNPILDQDRGRILSVKVKDRSPIFEGHFKTPGLRNVALTGPYMHHGGFETLEEVIAFYNHGGAAGLGLEVNNQTLPEDHLGLTQSEQQQLIRFLESLTDTNSLDLKVPDALPKHVNQTLNQRKIGGNY